MEHVAREQLEAGLDHIREAPADGGTVELIVRRPAVGERELVDSARLDVGCGLVGDTWNVRGSRRTPDGGPHPGCELTLMNARCADLLAGRRERWALAGDQLYVDLDLSEANLPVGARLVLGDAVVEVSEVPHTGCANFRSRFGADAMRFVNSEVGRALRLRGLNTRIVEAGTVRRGDVVRKA